MGAINFKTLTWRHSLAIVNQQVTENELEEEYFDWDFETVEQELKKHDFYYFSLFIDSGYYDGFYLGIGEENTRWIYHNSQEKAEALKELTKIKNILLNLVKDGIVWGCYPSWCTKYLTEKETIKDIRTIIKELKEEIKASYTETTAKRQKKNIYDIIKETEEKQRNKNKMELRK